MYNSTSVSKTCKRSNDVDAWNRINHQHKVEIKINSCEDAFFTWIKYQPPTAKRFWDHRKDKISNHTATQHVFLAYCFVLILPHKAKTKLYS